MLNRGVVLLGVFLSITSNTTADPLTLPRAGRPDPIRLIQIDGRRLGWADLYIGMSADELRDVILSEPVELTRLTPSCNGTDIKVEHRVTTLVVHLSKPWPRGKVLGLAVPLYDLSRTRPREKLVQGLKSRIPSVVFLPKPGDSAETEDLDPRPTYAPPHDAKAVIVLVPGEALILADTRCQQWTPDPGVFGERPREGPPRRVRRPTE